MLSTTTSPLTRLAAHKQRRRQRRRQHKTQVKFLTQQRDQLIRTVSSGLVQDPLTGLDDGSKACQKQDYHFEPDVSIDKSVKVPANCNSILNGEEAAPGPTLITNMPHESTMNAERSCIPTPQEHTRAQSPASELNLEAIPNEEIPLLPSRSKKSATIQVKSDPGTNSFKLEKRSTSFPPPAINTLSPSPSLSTLFYPEFKLPGSHPSLPSSRRSSTESAIVLGAATPKWFDGVKIPSPYLFHRRSREIITGLCDDVIDLTEIPAFDSGQNVLRPEYTILRPQPNYGIILRYQDPGSHTNLTDEQVVVATTLRRNFDAPPEHIDGCQAQMQHLDFPPNVRLQLSRSRPFTRSALFLVVKEFGSNLQHKIQTLIDTTRSIGIRTTSVTMVQTPTVSTSPSFRGSISDASTDSLTSINLGSSSRYELSKPVVPDEDKAFRTSKAFDLFIPEPSMAIKFHIRPSIEIGYLNLKPGQDLRPRLSHTREAVQQRPRALSMNNDTVKYVEDEVERSTSSSQAGSMGTAQSRSSVDMPHAVNGLAMYTKTRSNTVITKTMVYKSEPCSPDTSTKNPVLNAAETNPLGEAIRVTLSGLQACTSTPYSDIGRPRSIDVAVCPTPTCTALVPVTLYEHQYLGWPNRRYKDPTYHTTAARTDDDRDKVGENLRWIANDLGLEREHDTHCKFARADQQQNMVFPWACKEAYDPWEDNTCDDDDQPDSSPSQMILPYENMTGQNLGYLENDQRSAGAGDSGEQQGAESGRLDLDTDDEGYVTASQGSSNCDWEGVAWEREMMADMDNESVWSCDEEGSACE